MRDATGEQHHRDQDTDDDPDGEFDAPGLGLDIARRTAEAAGGTLRLETSELGGAKVVLSLRRRDAAGSGQ